MTEINPKKSKVTYTLHVSESETPDGIEQKLSAKRIKVLAMMMDENMSEWARLLGISRQAVYQVVEGQRRNPGIREFIEQRLGVRIWVEEGLMDQKKEAVDETNLPEASV